MKAWIHPITKILFTFIFRFVTTLSGIVSIGMLLFALSAQGQLIIPNSEPFEDDTFTKFVEDLTYLTNITDIQAKGLTKGFAAQEPWSGSYWPTQKGILGNRYSSPSFAKSRKFLENHASTQSTSANSLVYAGRINELSPSEKYDLLVGDSNWSLTRYMWDKGFRALQQNGVVAGWTGICHGWAAVTSMDPTSPYSAVTVKDVTGQHDITFYANDIKGLLSWLWAESSPNSFRAGNRCRKTHAPTDEFLRPNDPPCLDTNPMTWHLAMVNRVGLHKMSMVMDSSAGPEVWNYPITGYDYSYFDAKTYAPSNSFKSAMRRIQELPNDRFRAYRSPKAVYIVGVTMDTYHPALTEPNRGNTNHITTTKKTFVYDLELDGAMNIVGGEWYSKETPDFLWSFANGSKAGTREDVMLYSNETTWNARQQMSPGVATQARQAALRGEVLRSIVQPLLDASKKPVEAPPTDEEELNVEEEVSEDDEVMAPAGPSTPNPSPVEPADPAETPETVEPAPTDPAAAAPAAPAAEPALPTIP